MAGYIAEFFGYRAEDMSETAAVAAARQVCPFTGKPDAGEGRLTIQDSIQDGRQCYAKQEKTTGTDQGEGHKRGETGTS